MIFVYTCINRANNMEVVFIYMNTIKIKQNTMDLKKGTKSIHFT